MNEQAKGSRADWEERLPPWELGDQSAPSISLTRVDSCPVCGADRHDEYAVGFDYESQTCRNPWRFVACSECRHVWLNPRPAVTELATIYPPTYYAYSYEESINPIAVKGKEILDRGKMARIIRAAGRKPGSYLDIGCGSGRFLRFMEKTGIRRERIYGLELDADTVENLVSRGYSVFCDRVEDCAAIPESSIDLATMFHVIEHVDDPRAVIERVARWLRPGGRLCHGDAEHRQPGRPVVQKRIMGRLPHSAALESVLSGQSRPPVPAVRSGLGRYEVPDLSSFWMWSFHHKLKYGRRARPRLARRFDPFKSLPLLVLFAAFDRIRSLLGFKTSAMLLLARKPADRSASVSTLEDVEIRPVEPFARK